LNRKNANKSKLLLARRAKKSFFALFFAILSEQSERAVKNTNLATINLTERAD